MNRFRYVMSIFFAVVFLTYTISQAAFAKIDREKYEPGGNVVWEVPVNQKVVALTFDDGPDPIYTPEILDVLKKNHAKATFFLIGKYIKEYPELVTREVREGHELGNHTYSHVLLSRKKKSDFLEEINRTERLINKFQRPPRIKYLRPPGGNINRRTVRLSRKHNFEIILWSWHQDPRDWTNPGVSKIITHVLKNIHNGDIILLHDSGGNRRQTVTALKVILPILQKRGYRFVTLHELLKYDKKYDHLFNFGLENILEKPNTTRPD